MGKKPESRKHGMRTPGPETEEKYREAIELYRTTGLSVREICARTGVPFTAFRSFLHSCHRELMFARYGMEVTPEEAAVTRLRKRSGQTAASRAKYGEAIRACDDIAYIEYNVSQIAYMFHLDPSGLSSQLRNHYPEIIERRERERHRLGVNDNQHRGVKPWCKEQYAEAVEHLRTADLYGLSYSGLREHLLFYHKDLVRKRADKRERAKSGAKVRGALTGNGARHEPKAEQTEKYREAHNRLVEREEALRKEKEQAESAALALQRENEEKERILSALRQTGGNKRKAAKLLGFCKSTLYNKLNALGLNDNT